MRNSFMLEKHQLAIQKFTKTVPLKAFYSFFTINLIQF